MAETRHCLVCIKCKNGIENPGCEEQSGFFIKNVLKNENLIR